MSSKFRTLLYLAIGFAAGGFSVSAYDALDRGLSVTYGDDARRILEHENQTMHAILLHLLVEKPADDIRVILKDSDVFDFDKGESGSAAGNIFFAYENGSLIEIETTMTDTNVSQGDE